MQHIHTTSRQFVLAIALLMSSLCASAQGMVISEFFANPAGTDSAKETLELLVTETINFAVTPYSVIVNNNGTATANGWVAGGSLTYGFNITSGTVNAGDVVYVGGSQMVVAGQILRAINNVNTMGDGFGNASTSGVFGNGGGNADGIAVFNMAIGSVTASTVPVDAVFFGTGTGSAVVSGGTAGYELPINDLYAGGKLQTTSFIAPDPASGAYIQATGSFNTTTHTWAVARTFTSVTTYSATSGITLTTTAAPASVAFASTHQTVTEGAGFATFQLTVSNANSSPSSVKVEAVFGTATAGADHSFVTTTVNIPANGNGSYPVSVQILNDGDLESSEYMFFRLINPVNATVSGTNQYTLYISDNDNPVPMASNALSLSLVGSYSNGTAGSNSAEIVEFDPTTDYLYIANSIGNKLDIVNFSDPTVPVPVTSINLSQYGGSINSVAVRNGLVACAVESIPGQQPGMVIFFNATGTFLKSVTVGALPDMITFNHAGTKVYTANEGEPNAAYTNDPEGSISVVDISAGAANATVTTIGFTQFNGQEAALRAQGIRIYGPNATAAQDFEPEYITISDDDATAWVALQENNALVKINLLTNAIVELQPLGFKNHSLQPNALDASDQTNAVNIANWNTKGMYLPDAIHYYNAGGDGYILTANEGDARDYAGFSEETSIGSVTLDPTAFPDASFIQRNTALGRLKITNQLGDTDGDGDFDELYSYGGRSFSIRNAATGALVYDSGSELERITAADPVFGAMFNASNGGSTAPKNRSDDKGPEPEGIATGTIAGSTYAFVALERIGGVMVYDLSSGMPQYVTYANNRSLATNGPDRGSEGIIFIPASDSPTGQDLLILANEITSTLTIYSICPGGANVQTWYADADGDGVGNSAITVQACVQPTGYVAMDGDCNDNNATVYPGAPELCDGLDNNCDGLGDGNAITASFPAACLSTFLGYTPAASETLVPNVSGGSGMLSYAWSNGSTAPSITVSPAITTNYTVTVTDVASGCTSSASVLVEVFNAICSPTGSAKVYMCKNGVEVCVLVRLVQSYLNQGYSLGQCSSTPCQPFNLGSNPSVQLAINGQGQGVSSNSGLELSPNPASQSVQLTWGNPVAEQGQLRVLDMSGRTVLSQSLQADATAHILEVATWLPGVYVVQVRLGHEAFVKKLVVER